VRSPDIDEIIDSRSDEGDTKLSVIIGEMPFRGGWRFDDRKGCLPGTRKDFLDYVVEWVENPESERGLVFLGQAGTGKSSIAHEVARLFDKKCLGSYVAFLRKEHSKDEAYHLFTTLARDLSDRYPPFKLALGRVIKGNSSLRGTRDYPRLFEWLILEPLKSLQITGPVLLVIDGLDESGIAIGNNGLHTFLAQRLIEFPPNFRIFITSRSEDHIERAFAKALSVRSLYMDDAQLAANTEQDIGLYLQNELREDVFKAHGDKLAKASLGLFQWAAVACG
jgi:NACHT domain